MRIIVPGIVVAASCIGLLAAPMWGGQVKIKGKVQYARVTDAGKPNHLPHKKVDVHVTKINAPVANYGPDTSAANGDYEVAFNAANEVHLLTIFDAWNVDKPWVTALTAAEANKGTTKNVDLVTILCPCAAVGSGWTLNSTFKDEKNGNMIRTECTNGNKYGDFAFTFKKNGAAKAQAVGKCVFVEGRNNRSMLNKKDVPVNKEIEIIRQICTDPKATPDRPNVHQIECVFDVANGELKIIRRTRDGFNADGTRKHKDWGAAKTITAAQYAALAAGADTLNATLALIKSLAFDGDPLPPPPQGGPAGEEEESEPMILAHHGLVRLGVEPVIRWVVSACDPVLQPGDMIILSDLAVEDIVELDDRFVASMDAEGLVLTALEPVAPADGESLLSFSAGVGADPWTSSYVIVCPGATDFWSEVLESGAMPDGDPPAFASTAGMLNLEPAGACPIGAVQEHDGCGDLQPDANGGCNVDPASLQFAGQVDLDAPVNICGTVGTFGESSRDLDWYSFTLAEPSRVRVTMQHHDGFGNALPNATIFIINGTDCATSVTEYAAASDASPFISDEIALPAGEHTVIFTVSDFAPEGPACPSAYVGTIEVTEVLPAACGGPGGCAQASAAPGCSDLGCCADVCAVQQSCCDAAWDEFCVDAAIDLCELFVYACPPAGGAPSNDCATGAALAAFDVVYPFNTSSAGTDGPGGEACDQSKDLWYLVQVEHDGELVVDVSSPAFDSTISLYGLGPSGSFDPFALPGLHIGCVDVQGSGGEVAVLAEAAGGEFYLVRIAGFQGGFGEGTVVFTHKRVIFNTGNTSAVNFDATGMGNFTLTNLAWSSGALNAANPQRWSAQAFSVPDPGPATAWSVQAVHAYGFTPASAQNDTLHYAIWNRNGVANPNGETMVATGGVEFPVPFDILGGGANEDHAIDLAFADLLLEPGDYWLTVYAGGFSAPSIPASFAWYTNAQEGIPNLDPVTGQPRMWRSQAMPLPGFLVYTLSASSLQQQSGLDPNNVYNAGFRILGQVVATTACTGDLNGDDTVDGSDLGLMLASWCPAGSCSPSAADVNGDGIVNGADLGILLASWGGCP